MVPFEYTELDAENCINAECIKTIRVAGRSFKVIYKAVEEKWAPRAKSQFNLVQNELLGHYDVPNSVSMDGMRDEYEMEVGQESSVEELVVTEDAMDENIQFFREKLLLLIEKAPKIGYAVLLIFDGSKGTDFSKKLRLKHDGANKVRKVADKLLVDGLVNMDIDTVSCKKSQHTETYRKEALELLENIVLSLK